MLGGLPSFPSGRKGIRLYILQKERLVPRRCSSTQPHSHTGHTGHAAKRATQPSEVGHCPEMAKSTNSICVWVVLGCSTTGNADSNTDSTCHGFPIDLAPVLRITYSPIPTAKLTIHKDEQRLDSSVLWWWECADCHDDLPHASCLFTLLTSVKPRYCQVQADLDPAYMYVSSIYLAANKPANTLSSKNSLSLAHPFRIKSLPIVKPATMTSRGATRAPLRGRLLYHPTKCTPA